jgi:hypothetical protein
MELSVSVERVTPVISNTAGVIRPTHFQSIDRHQNIGGSQILPLHHSQTSVI